MQRARLAESNSKNQVAHASPTSSSTAQQGCENQVQVTAGCCGVLAAFHGRDRRFYGHSLAVFQACSWPKEIQETLWESYTSSSSVRLLLICFLILIIQVCKKGLSVLSNIAVKEWVQAAGAMHLATASAAACVSHSCSYMPLRLFLTNFLL